MTGGGFLDKLTIDDIGHRKGGVPQVWLTAYTKPMARLFDPHVDVILVGDSVGMVVYGLDSNFPVSLDLVIAHGLAVVRGAEHACVIIDMPLPAYESSPEQALRNAAKVMSETGCDAIKLEGGEAFAETVLYLTRRGIPVIGHVGITPHAVHSLGGYRARGMTAAEAERVRNDARAIEAAGVSALVIEGIVEPLAREITHMLKVPTIGIGASAECDGQILIADDMLGLFPDATPRFVKRYADLSNVISEATAQYADDVRRRAFPSAEHVFTGPPVDI